MVAFSVWPPEAKVPLSGKSAPIFTSVGGMVGDGPLTTLLLRLAGIDLLERVVRGDKEDERGARHEFLIGRIPLDCAIVACKLVPKKSVISNIM